MWGCELGVRCERVMAGLVRWACPRLAFGHGTRRVLIGAAFLLAGIALAQTPASAPVGAPVGVPASAPVGVPVGATCDSGGGAKKATQADVDGLAERLKDDDYRVREDATRRLLLLGAEIIPALEARLEQETDPEARLRLRFVLENVRPPQSAVLVLRPDYASSGLWAGDVITHVNNHRVHSRAELMRRLGELHAGAMLRVRRVEGPLEMLLKVRSGLPVLCDYRAPEGETVANALRLYDYGYAERAYELLRGLEPRPPESELPALLYAIVAYTAGDAKTAYEIVAEHPDACEPVSVASSWTSPSALDLAGPRGAPYHLEWALWSQAERSDAHIDRDLPIQRVAVPAGRFADALQQVASMWWGRNRSELGKSSEGDRAGGNLLAVSAWMMSELDLASESMRMVEPRSVILRNSPQGVHKWVRVRTDAWLPFARGEPRAALDGFYEDARAILQPPGPPADRILIQNPRIAAQVAFFLYQFPTDERVSEMLSFVNQPDYAPLAEYAHWMLYALRAENFAVEREHLLAMLANAWDTDARDFALAAALLEYVRERPDMEVFAAARERLADALAGSDKQATAALVAALEHLAAGDARQAGEALSAAGDQAGATVLRSTAEFLAATAATPPLDANLRRPILAVPAGSGAGKWLVLTRARQFVRCDLSSGESVPVSVPNANWFPGPLNWPWIGREESSGRLWIYELRRVTELTEAGGSGVRLNIRTEDIVAFDRYVRRSFSALAELAGEVRLQGETGELWREDVQAGQEYFSDPDLPEIGFIRALPRAQRIVQVAFRGGGHLLIDAADGRSWSSRWIAEQLGLDAPPRFLAQAVEPSAAEDLTAEDARSGGPVLYLFSDAGLLRLDAAKGEVRRIELPGPEAHPVLVPEFCPYERRDPCWVYCARLPEAGGRVYRVSVGDDHVEVLDMVNESLPREYYLMQSRAEMRRKVDELLVQAGVPALRGFISDSEQLLAKYPEVSK